MFVWMAKFGAAYGVRTGIHVGVDVLINRLDAGLCQIHRFGLLAGALFTGVFATGDPSCGRTAPTTRSSPGATSKGYVRVRPRPIFEWPTWIGTMRHSVRLGPDVLPLPAGIRHLEHRRAGSSSLHSLGSLKASKTRFARKRFLTGELPDAGSNPSATLKRHPNIGAAEATTMNCPSFLRPADPC